jgi:hypothetical protein
MAQIRFYKPYSKDGQPLGAASQFDYRPNPKKPEVLAFWDITKQTGEDENGNATFAWTKDKSKTIKVKLGLPDIGEILAVLKGVKGQAGTGKGLFHKNATGNTSIVFQYYDGGGDIDKRKYTVKITNQSVDGSDKVLTSVGHSLTLGEGVVLEQFLNGLLEANFLLSERVNRSPVEQE